MQSGDGGCILACYDHVDNDDLRVLLEDVSVVFGVLAVERGREGNSQEKEQSHG